MESIFRWILLFAVVYASVHAYIPKFFRGRSSEGLVIPPDHRMMSLRQWMQLKNDPPNEEWFEQKLDHFNPAETRTWQQRYFKAGPATSDTMFVMIGGEGPASEGWMTTGMWNKYAETYNAVRLQLEHRYYGESHPTEDVSIANLQYLSSEQALSDLASFISAKKKEHGASKVIVVGGSYSGNLAAWFRLKYPHLADGALATSAPVLAQVNFKGYLEVVAQSLNTFKPANACNNNISAAVKIVKQKLQTPEGRKELKEKFNLCDDIDISVEEDIANLFEALAGNFMGVVQYNNIIPGRPTIDDLCKIMTDTSVGDECDRYAKVSLYIQGGSCLGVKYSDVIKFLQAEDWSSQGVKSGMRPWFYQTCTEFGYYQSSDSDSQPFGHDFPIDFSLKLCTDAYGSKFDAKFVSGAVNASNVNYGGRHYTEDRVVFTNGNIDPWHYLSITDKLPQATVIFINGTAHCANMYGERDSDPPGLIEARKQIAKTIAQWLQ